MSEDLDGILGKALEEAAAAADLKSLDGIRVAYLGKSGAFTEQLKRLGKLPAEERPKAGQAINRAKQALQQAIEERRKALEDAQAGAGAGG